MATHYHPDHIGLVSELIEYGARLILINTQLEYVHFSDDIFFSDKRLRYEPINAESAICITCSESRAFLYSMGIEGKIISTPSHSKDNISVILDSGICFVGDLEPINYIEAYDNNSELKKDWELVMSYSPETIYYAHANEKRLL